MAVSALKKETQKDADKLKDAGAAAPPAARPWKRIAVAGVALLCILSAVLYWYMRPSVAAEAPKAADKPIYLVLEPFTVNLKLEDNPQFLQVGITLKMINDTSADALKQHMPELRNSILLLLSARKASELLKVEGKKRLADDIALHVNAIIEPRDGENSKPAETPAAQPPAAASADGASASESVAAVGDAAAPAPTPPADSATPQTATAETPAAAPTRNGPVLGVLFTSFIIQ